MAAIYKRELKSYFHGLTGWLFIAIMLLVFGIYTVTLCLNQGYADFSLVPYNALFIYLIVVPLLTMRSLAEERRQKTDQLLYSSTLHAYEIVLGKYLAMITVLSIPTAICFLYPWILSAHGRVPLGTAYSAMTAFFFLGAALIAIGLFFSSLSQSQFVSAAFTFGALLLCYFAGELQSMASAKISTTFAFLLLVSALLGVLTWVLTRSRAAGIVLFALPALLSLLLFLTRPQSLDGSAAALLSVVALFARIRTFCDGIFDIGALIYFVSVAWLFLFFSVQVFEKRKWS